MRRPAELAMRIGSATRPLPAVLVLGCAVVASAALAADWPEFLGPGGRGVAAGPIRSSWSEPAGIAWKHDLPGRGNSSPIVVGDLVVVTACSGSRQDLLHVIACDVRSGAVRWHRTFWATGQTGCQGQTSVAAPTPASDGERIVAFFSSSDVFSLDLAGRLLWQRNLAVERPLTRNDAGMGSSPRIVGDAVVVQIDNESDSFVTAIDLATGGERWTVPREKVCTWSSPVAVERPDGPCVLLQNSRGLDLRRADDGSLVWSWRGECDAIATTACAEGVLYAPASGLAALPLDGRHAAPAWRSARLGCSIASPLVWGDSVACIGRTGVLGIGSRGDGAVRRQLRLAGEFWASPILVGDTIVAVNTEGKTFLVSVAGEPRVVATNELPGTFTATPACADGCLYLRSDWNLWKIAAP